MDWTTAIMSRRAPRRVSGGEASPEVRMGSREPGPEASREAADRIPQADFPRFVFRFFRLSWETSTFKNYHPEDSEHPGSRRIEFSSKSTTLLT